jgi:hypothetical protein
MQRDAGQFFSPVLASVSLGMTLLFGGCFSSGPVVVTGTVSGKVLLDGKPVVPGCAVVFNPDSPGADIGSGLVGEDGTYKAVSGKLSGVPVGEYKVTIQPPAMDEKEKEDLEKKNAVTILTAMMNRDKKALKSVENPQSKFVPVKYWTVGTSGLKFTVAKGDNVADFQLVPDKKK